MAMLVEACLDKWLLQHQRASKMPKDSSRFNHIEYLTINRSKMQRCKKAEDAAYGILKAYQTIQATISTSKSISIPTQTLPNFHTNRTPAYLDTITSPLTVQIQEI